jgi:hypothetical protein
MGKGRRLILKMFNLKNIMIMKKILLLLLSGVVTVASAQHTILNSFFDKVGYIGAFDGVNNWTAGWTEWDPVDAAYPATTAT